MKNLEILKEALLLCSARTSCKEENDILRVIVELYGINSMICLHCDFDQNCNLDNVVSTFKEEFDYMLNAEEYYFFMYQDIDSASSAQISFDTWEYESNAFMGSWDEFKNELIANIDDIQTQSDLLDEIGAIDWVKPKYNYEMFINMCAGDMCAFPGMIEELLIQELSEEEYIQNYTIKEHEEIYYYLVRTSKNRIICLNYIC